MRLSVLVLDSGAETDEVTEIYSCDGDFGAFGAQPDEDAAAIKIAIALFLTQLLRLEMGAAEGFSASTGLASMGEWPGVFW